MAAAPLHTRLDALGVTLSALCLVHCLALPLLATGALAWAASEHVHAGLAIALAAVVRAVAVPGYRRHRRAAVPALLAGGATLLVGAVVAGEALGETALSETALTVLGSLALVAGHALNLRLPHAHP